jgi:hypothetical protein
MLIQVSYIISLSSEALSTYLTYSLTSPRFITGNVHFRSLVDYYRLQYGTAKKVYKSNIAKTIVKAVRKRHGRFLKKSDTSEVYFEIGDVKAKDKTSQTLREGMAKLVRCTLTAKADEKNVEVAEPTIKRQKLGEAADNVVLDSPRREDRLGE